MRRTTLAILAACILPVASPALAQTAGGGAAGSIRQNATDVVGPVINTSFTGGTLADYIDALKHVAGNDAPTVMVRGDAEAVTIAPVDLREIQLFNALRLLDGSHIDSQGSRVIVTSINVARDPGTKPAYLVQIESSNRGGASPFAGAQPSEFLVLPLQEITTPLPGDPPEVVVPAETVLTAVESALELAAQTDPAPEMRYHAESGLLILSGPKPALSAARDIVSAIWDGVNERRDRARDIQRAQGLANPDALEMELADARAEVELASVRMDTARQRLELSHQGYEQMEVQVEEGYIPEQELLQRRYQIAEAEAEVREHEIEVERAAQRVHQIEKSLQRSQQINAGGASGSEADALRAENKMLRERLAVLEAQINKMNEELKGRNNTGGGRSSR